MSLFKYGDLEREIDFTDVDFLENLAKAQDLLQEEVAQVPKVGKTADIIRAQCQCYFNFIDRVIGKGAHEEMFQGKTSLSKCFDAIDALREFENDTANALSGKYEEYTVQQHGNRQQRRKYDKSRNKNHNKNRGNAAYYNGNR